MGKRGLSVLGIGFLAGGFILMVLAGAFGGPGASPLQAAPWGVGPGGMMGCGDPNASSASDPGSTGFVAGSVAAPRVVRIVASETLRFIPDVVTVQEGGTITCGVTTDGRRRHESLVVRGADVAAGGPGPGGGGDPGLDRRSFLEVWREDTSVQWVTCGVAQVRLGDTCQGGERWADIDEPRVCIHDAMHRNSLAGQQQWRSGLDHIERSVFAHMTTLLGEEVTRCVHHRDVRASGRVGEEREDP